jgi:hypothetical protein
LTSLDSSSDHLSGVFTESGQSLVFEVSSRGGSNVVELSTKDGQTLYFTAAGPDGLELRVGDGFRSTLPRAEAARDPKSRRTSPQGFTASGDLLAEYEHLKDTPLALLPQLTAALGSAGFDGKSSPLALRLHLLALELAEQGVFSLDPVAAAAANRKMSGEPAPTTAAPADELGEVASALSADYSGTSYCSSGVGRRPLGDMTGDPCRDDCFGMCGPGCTPWDWVCGDTHVHALCWQHDSAYCPLTLGSILGIPIPNPDYPVCMTEYALFTASTEGNSLLDNCEFDEPVPFGIWSSHPDFYANYQPPPTPPAPTFEVATFDAGDTRFFTDTGDWSYGDYKAECAQNQKLIGISATAVSPELRAHSALCVSTWDTMARGATTHSFDGGDDRADTATGDWDVGYTKAECDMDETITGISQTGDLRLSKIQCGWIESEVGNSDQGCTTLVFSSTSDNQLASDPGDWAIGFSKNQCRSNQYLKGVSSNPTTGEIHALLCCDAVPFPH